MLRNVNLIKRKKGVSSSILVILITIWSLAIVAIGATFITGSIEYAKAGEARSYFLNRTHWMRFVHSGGLEPSAVGYNLFISHNNKQLEDGSFLLSTIFNPFELREQDKDVTNARQWHTWIRSTFRKERYWFKEFVFLDI